MEFKQNLELHIRARYPVLYLTTYEEGRIERILGEIAKEQKKRLVVWASTTGFVEGDKVIEETAADLTEAFKSIVADSQNNGKTLYLFKDLHRKMAEPGSVVYRLVRDTAPKIKKSKVTIILMSPMLEFPKELEKVVTPLDVPYPNASELRAVLETQVAGAQKAVDGIVMPENGEMETILRSAAGLTEEEFENIVSKSLLQYRKIDPRVVVAEKESTIRKSGLVEIYEPIEGLEDVGGLEELKVWTIRCSKSFTQKAIQFGIRPPRGVFLAGVTGCGKTLSGKAMASFMKVPFLMVDPAKILGAYVGQSEQALRQLFKLARAVAPCILFFDEMEKMMPQGVQGDSGVSSKQFGMLLTEMQECPASTPVLFVMTANDPLRLPPELWTRFDAVFFVDLPTVEERIQVWAVQIRKPKRDPTKFDLRALAEASEGWTGREMEFVVNDALSRAFEAGGDLETETILSVLKGRQPISVQRKADIDKMRNWGKDTAMPASRKAAKGSDERKLEF